MDEQGEITGQGRPKMAQSAEGGEGKDKRESLWLLEAPVRKIILHMHTPSAHKSVLEWQTPTWTWRVHRDAPGQWHRQRPTLE